MSKLKPSKIILTFDDNDNIIIEWCLVHRPPLQTIFKFIDDLLDKHHITYKEYKKAIDWTDLHYL